MKVGQIMTRAPFTIDPMAPIATALAVMRERKLRHLPVVDDTGRLVGIVTDRDLRSALLAPALAEHLSAASRRRLRALAAELEGLRVRDVMTWEVVTIEPEASLARAAALMLERQFGSLPVVEGGRLVGILTERDALRALAATVLAVKAMDPALLW